LLCRDRDDGKSGCLGRFEELHDGAIGGRISFLVKPGQGVYQDECARSVAVSYRQDKVVDGLARGHGRPKFAKGIRKDAASLE
jgi:hypothetical protein